MRATVRNEIREFFLDARAADVRSSPPANARFVDDIHAKRKIQLRREMDVLSASHILQRAVAFVPTQALPGRCT
jgi:hypothetical protein